MKRLLTFLSVVCVLSVLSSCGKAALGPVGLQGENVLASIRDLNKAYERRDLDAFMELVSPAYPDREGFRKAVENIFLSYQTIKQKVFTNRMQVYIQEKGNIKAVFTWEGEWQTKGGKIVKDGARSTLVLDKGVFKLMDVEGKNPYLLYENPVPARQ
jgi:hypothetical protein